MLRQFLTISSFCLYALWDLPGDVLAARASALSQGPCVAGTVRFSLSSHLHVHAQIASRGPIACIRLDLFPPVAAFSEPALGQSMASWRVSPAATPRIMIRTRWRITHPMMIRSGAGFSSLAGPVQRVPPRPAQAQIQHR